MGEQTSEQIIVCETCGVNSTIYAVSSGKDYWDLNRIEMHYKDGDVSGTMISEILTCPKCSKLDREKILEMYKKRIRAGLVGWFH